MSKTDIGIDLGTANTVITLGKKGVVLSEPSAIAYHTHTKEVLAVGKRAYQMIGKTPDYIEVIRPLSGGVISDDRMTQYKIANSFYRSPATGSPSPASSSVCRPLSQTWKSVLSWKLP